MSFSISDFAEKAMMGVPTPKAPSNFPKPESEYLPDDGTDISNVSVPEGFVQGIFEQTSTVPPSVATPPLREDSLNEEISEIKGLLTEMKTILIAVSRVLAEQTAVGSIGVGPATTKKKRKESSDELLKRIRTRKS